MSGRTQQLLVTWLGAQIASGAHRLLAALVREERLSGHESLHAGQVHGDFLLVRIELAQRLTRAALAASEHRRNSGRE